MDKSLKIGKREAIALIVSAIVSKIHLGYQAVLAAYGGGAAWMIVLISGLLSLALFGIIFKYLDRFPGRTFPETVEEIVGPYFGFFIVLSFLAAWLFDVALVLRRISDIVEVTSLPNVPLGQILATLILVACLGASTGLKRIAGLMYLIFPFVIGTILLVFFATANRWEINWLFPVLGEGAGQLIKQGVVRSGDYQEANILYVLPLWFYHKQVREIGCKSVIISMAIMLLAVLSYTLTFPPAVGQEPYAPFYQLIRSIYISRFIQRVELLYVLFWIVNACMWLSAGLFGFCFLLSRWLKLPDYRPLILPGAILTVAAALIPAGLPEATLMYLEYRKISFIGFYGWPALLLLIAIIRQKGVGTDAAPK